MSLGTRICDCCLLGAASDETLFYNRKSATRYATYGGTERCLALWLHMLDAEQRDFDTSCSYKSSFTSYTLLFNDFLKAEDVVARRRLSPNIEVVAVH